MTIWKQGDYYKNLGESIATFDHHVDPGPSDDLIKIHGFRVLSDKNGHFIQSENGIKYSNDEMDAIRTFAIARQLIKLMEGLIGKPIRWQWNNKENTHPIKIYIRNSGINSRYQRGQKCIELDVFGPYQNWTYYCRSVDIVAHEIGHAILDGLKPGWYNADVETRGLAEAFCDFCAMLMITSNIDLCEEVCRETNGDFRKNNILSLFGAGYGFEENPHSCIRNAINTVQLNGDFQTTYDYGELIVGFLYDVLTKKTTKEISARKNPSLSLFEAAIPWAHSIIRGILSCNDEKTTMKEFISHFQSSFGDDKILEKSLSARNLH